MGAAEARATKLSNITDLTVCANVWLAVVLMMCIIYIYWAPFHDSTVVVIVVVVVLVVVVTVV